jgi:hypothetical protein
LEKVAAAVIFQAVVSPAVVDFVVIAVVICTHAAVAVFAAVELTLL